MTKLKVFYLRNAMLLANFLANLIGVLFASTFISRAQPVVPDGIWRNPVVHVVDTLFSPCAFIFVCVMTLLYERPIRRSLTAASKHEPIPEDLAMRARRKLLNEPFVLIALSSSMWLLSAILYPAVFWVVEAGPYAIERSLYRSISTGLITVTVAFFLLEHVLQKWLAPLFFPEACEPKKVVKLINAYFESMAGAIEGHGGLVLQFIGDEIMAVFGAPIAMSDHPKRAILAALEMNRRLEALNRALEGQDFPTLSHGIGIHTGETVAANIGSTSRRSYTLMGDTVNLSSRLQSLTKEIGTKMILSAVTHSHLTQEDLVAVELRKLPPTPIKGKKLPVELYVLTS